MLSKEGVPPSRMSLEITGKLLQRFWSKVDKSGGDEACWPWTAAVRREGYGAIKVNGRLLSSHILSWRIHNGGAPVPMGSLVEHIECDNPRCVNPSHLCIGTFKTNYDHMVAKGRRVVVVGENLEWSKLTECDVLRIRELYVPRKFSARKVAEVLGLPLGPVERVIYGESWNHVG